MRLLLTPFSLLLLVACNGDDPVADNADAAIPVSAELEAANPPPPPADGSLPANRMVETSGAPAKAAATIPAFLHGRWGMTPDDCTSTRGDAKGLLEITPQQLRFYESRAVPIGNIGGTKDSFTGDFRFSGEGQTWTSFETLQLQRTRLIRTTSSPMASYTYAKCD